MHFCYYEKIGNVTRNITEEIPFDIPDSWEWARLGSLYQHNTGKALNSSNTKGEKHQYITTSNLYWGKFQLDHLKEMPFTDDEIEKCTVKYGDLLVCEGGDIGRAAIWTYPFEICIQNHVHRLRAYYSLETRFYYYCFFIYKAMQLIGGKGIGIQGLSSNAIDSLLLPVPPFEEQKRIVKRIEELIAKIKDEA